MLRPMPRRIPVLLLATLLSACAPVATPSPSAPAATTAVPVATALPAVEPTAVPPTEAPTLAAADLDGVLTAPELAHRLPLVVSIDDGRRARPQAGFNAASIVWQAPADGYETRYLLAFQESDASTVGPVRSARIYLAQWAAEYRAAFAHYGGDRLSRAWMTDNRGELFTDIDGLGSGRPAYHRIGSREAPYNAYTSTDDLWRVAAKLGGAEAFDTTLHVRPFREDSPAAERGTAQSIGIPYNTVRVGYTYDPAINAYRRLLDGKPHLDDMDGAQVTARTVVVLFMTFRTSGTIEPGHSRPVLGFIGTGTAMVFMEGRMIEATWQKGGIAEPTLILGPDGAELPLLRGRIIIQVVPIATKVAVAS